MGLRERKKEKTRLALIDAALDLFLEQGYEATTVDQIAGAVDVSARTFFRYFATKEDLALYYHLETEEIINEALAGRPEDEPPFSAVCHAFRAFLRNMEESTPADSERFLKTRRLAELTPLLMHRSLAAVTELEKRLTVKVAGRQGLDPELDLLPHLVVAFVTSAVRVGFECPAPESMALPDLVRRVEAALSLAESSLKPGWDLAS